MKTHNINPAKLTTNSAPYAAAAKVLKGFGVSSAIFGLALDINAFSNGKMGGAKLSLNTGVTAWGFGVGAAAAIPGFIGGAVYFGVDAFYPNGGWEGAMKDQSKLSQDNHAINPEWQIWPGAMKQ